MLGEGLCVLLNVVFLCCAIELKFDMARHWMARIGRTVRTPEGARPELLIELSHCCQLCSI
jgi:hypothetical protein